MLSKLMKYEWKACARACLPIYGAALVVALVNRLLSVLGLESALGGMPTMIAAMVYFGVMVAVFVVTAVILIQRFYKSLLGDEGYLMFTLPATAGQHIWAKSIIALVMCMLSGVAAMLSVVILAAQSSLPQDILNLFTGFFRMFHESEFGVVNGVFYGLEVLAFALLSGLFSVLFIYLCIALGHMAKKHRVAMAIIWYFVLSTVVQIVVSVVLLGSGNGTAFELLFGWISRMPAAASIHVAMLLMCICAAIPTAVCFFGTRYILQNKLNLE